jgi:general secretion pathway protein J
MRRRAAAGFTLLEMLVALAVFGFLLVGLNQTMHFGLTAWRQDARISGRNTELEAVDRSLRLVVENLFAGDDLANPPIAGTADSLIGLSRLRTPDSGMRPIRVEAGLALSGNRLVLRWRPYHHWAAFRPPEPPRETDLLDGVGRLQIAYWGATGTWVSHWDEPALPLLIRFRVTMRGERRWPDIVIAPLLSRS